MAIRDFAYVVQSRKSPREALADLWKAALQANWIVLGDYDLSGILQAEGTAHREIKSLDICRLEYARDFVKAEPMTALCMPCNILIYQQDGSTMIAAMMPSVMLPHLFEHALTQLGDNPRYVDRELQAIIDAAK